jgi:hypothetical protein
MTVTWMSRLRIRSLIVKEFRQLRRDRRSLRLFVFAPVMQLLRFGYGVSTDLRNVRLAVALRDRSAAAREVQVLVDGSDSNRGVFLKGQRLADLWPQAVALLALGSTFYRSGMPLFRKRAA